MCYKRDREQREALLNTTSNDLRPEARAFIQAVREDMNLDKGTKFEAERLARGATQELEHVGLAQEHLLRKIATKTGYRLP